ncbi:MAG: hypothetical protein M1816_005783 [Peltula sp. TS41687]|nr:MAG: hypothetical protein M1816_005783 [Peltula sp. TS41687]
MSSVAERKNQQIWDALDANNSKQALQLCMKRIKKGEKGDYIHALKAYILTQWASAGYRKDGFVAAKTLVEKDPPITDLETLSLLLRSLESLGTLGQAEPMNIDIKHYATLLWERALKANPGDETLARECFFSYLQQRDWRNAQKTAPDSVEADRKLFGNLAYKMISKAASEVPTDPQVLLSPGRSISTPEELQLLVTIFRRANEASEALRILDSQNLGISSSVAKGDWSFVRHKLEILEEQKRWHDVWTFCKDLLVGASSTLDDKTSSEATNGDDWTIWKAFIGANTQLNKSEPSNETEAVITSFLGRSPVGRNALLARLHFDRAEISSNHSPKASSNLLSSCQRYFDNAASKICCYDDLRDTIELLDLEAQQSLLDHAKETCERIHSSDQSDKGTLLRWITARVNELKLHLHLRISQLKRSHPDTVNFITDCVNLYKVSLSAVTPSSSSNNPGEDACILAAMVLVHLSQHEKPAETWQSSSPCLLQAAALLEFLLSHSAHNYQALLILVRIYGILGCHPLAFKTYSRLSIKNIQLDTIAHNLLTRISTLHPWPVADRSSKKGNQDPSLELQRALTVHKKSEDQISKMIKLAVEQGSYNQIPGFLALGEQLDKSICKCMYQIESRRIMRFIHKKGSVAAAPDVHAYDLPLAPLSDNRDDGVMLNFERLESPSFEEYIRIGPKPGATWVTAFTVSEHLVASIMFRKDNGSEAASTANIESRLEVAAKELKEICAMEDTTLEFTKLELSYLTLCALVHECFRGQWDGSASKNAPDMTLLQEINVWLGSKAGNSRNVAIVNGLQELRTDQSFQALSWETLHNAFMTLDVLKILAFALHERTPRGRTGDDKTLQAALTYTTKLVTELYEEVRSKIIGHKNVLSESGAKTRLGNSILGEEDGHQGSIGAVLGTLMSASWVEAFTMKVSNSWQEALDGVLYVKID